MLYRLAADGVVIIHALFVLFVLVGGFLTWKWRWLIWLHLPAAIWGVIAELFHIVCPLTPLENELRIRAGLEGYAGGFVDHCLAALLYPQSLTASIQIVLGAIVIGVNAVAYAPHLSRLVRR